eukprot:752664-Hanusia_phi.AAC.1
MSARMVSRSLPATWIRTRDRNSDLDSHQRIKSTIAVFPSCIAQIKGEMIAPLMSICRHISAREI